MNKSVRKRSNRQKSKRAKRAEHARATRETIESIIVAVMLAFLFRTFVAEAFVIPTGSMAPTLQGRHMDVACPECGYQYRSGASIENADNRRRSAALVTNTTCPLCRYELTLDRDGDANQRSFNGDRILVSKFAYALGKPQRWDVIVFKYPGNAKQNYIKRLIGLPGETIMIRHGDVWTRSTNQEDAPLRITRKPDRKLLAMLQMVDDTKYIARDVKKVGWPAPYQPWSKEKGYTDESWTILNDGHHYQTDGSHEHDAYIRYQHRLPDWDAILVGNLFSNLDGVTDADLKKIREEVDQAIDDNPPRLITDYYAYNDYSPNSQGPSRRQGLHWVGDLALEAQINVQSSQGELLLDLVEGGVHYECRIDLSSGKARLLIDGGRGKFGEAETLTEQPTAQTAIKSSEEYWVRFSNVDDELRLWVNDRRIEFDGPTTYHRDSDAVPHWTPKDPYDLAPAGIGSKGAAIRVERARVFRDVYYIAAKYDEAAWPPIRSDNDYDEDGSTISRQLRDFRNWDKAEQPSDAGYLFTLRKSIQFELPENGYLPLGDNSPQSKDARFWAENPDKPTPTPEYVKEELMIGKALLVYWPHTWRTDFLIGIPNFERMGFIR